LVNQGAGYLNGGAVPTRMGNQHPSIAPYETLSTADGSLAVAVGNDRQFQLLTATLGRPELGFDERFDTNPARVGHRGELVRALEDALSTDSTANWAIRLRAAGVPCGPVHDIAGAIDLAASLGLDPVVRFDPATSDTATTETGSITTGSITTGSITTMASPLRFSGSPVRYDRAPPQLGADSAEVRAWLMDGRPLHSTGSEPKPEDDQD